MSRWSRSLAGLGVALVALAGCGVPTGSAPERIAASDVPYGLAERATPTQAPLSGQPAADDPRVYLVAADDRLVPKGRDVGQGSREERLGELLSSLAEGPTKEERAEQLATALQPGVELTVTEMDGTEVTIDIGGVEGTQSPEESRRAVGQIVLTATSLPGVEMVRLTTDGQRVDAPLPTGELTSRPLTADDYQVLLTAPVPPRVSTAPFSAQTTTAPPPQPGPPSASPVPTSSAPPS
jgi:hypothetical protein